MCSRKLALVRHESVERGPQSETIALTFVLCNPSLNFSVAPTKRVVAQHQHLAAAAADADAADVDIGITQM